MIKGKKRSATLVLVLILAAGVSTYGWDSEGHMAVAYVAYQRLEPATKQRVNELLKLNPYYAKWKAQIPNGTSTADADMMMFVLAATWPDEIKRDSQYHDDGTSGGDRPDGPTSSQNIGYADHLRHKYWHFVDTPFSQDGTALPSLPTPNAETQITAFRAVLSSDQPDALKSYDLVWLLHLVGDVHQPLHCTTRVSHDEPNGDAGGNFVTLCSAPCKNELHAFWDNLMGTQTAPSAAIRAGSSLAVPDPTLASNTDVAVWVHESFSEAQVQVYVEPIGPGMGPFAITATYRATARDLARQRIALAGARLASVLNSELK
jgi:S1/P1 Nuclease